MRITSAGLALLVAVSLTSLGACRNTVPLQSQATTAPVVFVCEHGNVKSLISASLFNQAAKEQGLTFRAVSRGVDPEASVPPKIANALRSEGIDVSGFKPQPLTARDVSEASRVIAIGFDLSSFNGEARVPIDSWADVPPASIDYPASRAALLRHIGVLLEQLRAN